MAKLEYDVEGSHIKMTWNFQSPGARGFRYFFDNEESIKNNPKYRGKFLAVANEEIIETGNTFEELFERVKQRGLDPKTEDCYLTVATDDEDFSDEDFLEGLEN